MKQKRWLGQLSLDLGYAADGAVIGERSEESASRLVAPISRSVVDFSAYVSAATARSQGQLLERVASRAGHLSEVLLLTTKPV